MNRSMPTGTYSQAQLNLLHDRAHAQATALRREAIESFLSAAVAWIGSSSRRTHAAGKVGAAGNLGCAH